MALENTKNEIIDDKDDESEGNHGFLSFLSFLLLLRQVNHNYNRSRLMFRIWLANHNCVIIHGEKTCQKVKKLKE